MCVDGWLIVVFVKMVKGFGMGEVGEGQNVNYQLKKMSVDVVCVFCDCFVLLVSDVQFDVLFYLKLELGSVEVCYFVECCVVFGGYVLVCFYVVVLLLMLLFVVFDV